MQDTNNKQEIKEPLLKTEKTIKYEKVEHFLGGKNWIDGLIFSWVSSFVSYGNHADITLERTPKLLKKDQPIEEFQRINRILQSLTPSKTQGLTLCKAIVKTFYKELLFIGTTVLIVTAIQLMLPILTNIIINFISQGSQNRDTLQAIQLFCIVFLLNIIRTLTQSHMFYKFGFLGYSLVNTLSLLIYQKVLRYPILCEKQYDVSQIINFSQIDAQRMSNLGFQLVCLIFAPLQIIVGVWLVYYYIGQAFLVGMAVMILTMLFTFFFMKFSIKFNDQLLKAKDKRVKAIQEMLNIIRFIKMNAFQKPFFSRVNEKRNNELKICKKTNLLNILTIFVYWSANPLILSSTFATYTWMGNQMNASSVFTTIMLFNILQLSIRFFPTAISEIIQIWASIKRIQKFLFAKQMSHGIVRQVNEMQFAIRIINGTFMWGREEERQKNDKDNKSKEGYKNDKDNKSKNSNNQNHDNFNKHNENSQEIISDSQNKLYNQQKTTEPLSTQIVQKQQVSIQQSILTDTQNCVLQSQYITVLHDINMEIKKGKLTMIFGQIGSGKSSLLYAILNEMKAKAQSLIEINGKTMLAPQKPWIMAGTIKQNIILSQAYQQKLFSEAIHYSFLQQDLQVLSKGVETQIGDKGINLSGGQKARIELARAIYSRRDILLLDDIISAVDVNIAHNIIQSTICGHLKNCTIIMPTHAIMYAEKADDIIILKNGRIILQGQYHNIKSNTLFQQLQRVQRSKQLQQKQKQHQNDNKIFKQAIKCTQDNASNNLIQQLILPEDHKRGSIGNQVYLEYIKLNGGILFVIIITIGMIGWLVSSTTANIWIQHWCQHPQEGNRNLYLYVGLSISSSLFTILRCYTIIISGINQGRIVHQKIIKSLLYTSISKFYNRIPIGRILNRLTKDIGELDQNIGYAFGNTLVSFFSVLGSLIICLYASTLWLLFPIIVVSIICYKLKNYYLKTQRECVRLQNITNSPLVSGFMETVRGVTTLRAASKQQAFLNEQIKKITSNKTMRIARQACESWFSIRLAILSFIINMSAIGFCLFSDNDNPSYMGLLLSYALIMSQNITDFIFRAAYLQTKMVSVERVIKFMQIQPQDGYVNYCQQWSHQEEGYKQVITNSEIEFQNVSVRYRDDIPPSLINITLNIKSGQKVGIVGRTGAGKSTLINVLLRFLEPYKGVIRIGGKDYREIFIKDLRHSITMIDQEPAMIRGSFKQNLDPLNLYSTQQLMKITKECNLEDIIIKKGGLHEEINNDNLSVGEKQLICICRAFLKRSHIVLIDQATANIDCKNDYLIQQVIRNKFNQSTVLTIAHRLSTLNNSDRILVLGEGSILEWGRPNDLLMIENGIYREMWEKNKKYGQEYLS